VRAQVATSENVGCFLRLKFHQLSLINDQALNDCRSLYKQLIEETPVEKFDERRVNLLKSQVIQLERQVRKFVT